MMENLAGVESCDKSIVFELFQAGINIIPVQGVESEVPYSFCGVLGEKETKISREEIPTLEKLSDHFKFVFKRAWYYWVIDGIVLLDVALVLFNNPIGKTDIRASGHCGCPSPDEKREDGSYIWAHLFSDEEKYAIFSYHINSQDGLNLFVRTLKEHKLI